MPIANHVTRSRCIVMTPDRLTYALAVESRYLGEMAELDHTELADTYMAFPSMELALIHADMGSGIKCTTELRVLNYKKVMQSPNTEEWLKEICNEKVQFDK